jgi:hypothetical protein
VKDSDMKSNIAVKAGFVCVCVCVGGVWGVLGEAILYGNLAERKYK